MTDPAKPAPITQGVEQRGSKTYRLVADTARGPLIMRMPHRAGIAAGFGGELDYASLTLENVPSPYRVTFYAVPLSQR